MLSVAGQRDSCRRRRTVTALATIRPRTEVPNWARGQVRDEPSWGIWLLSVAGHKWLSIALGWLQVSYFKCTGDKRARDILNGRLNGRRSNCLNERGAACDLWELKCSQLDIARPLIFWLVWPALRARQSLVSDRAGLVLDGSGR